ncbi:MAG: GTP 3',8-cyclase MoaA [Clostridia bacterium]|nr:GTP 3',8-cyclase MoaA [Clostridia bacterium]
MIDRFGREINYLRVSVTDKCNLRCRYCMPAEGVCKRSHEEMLREEEMIMAVRAAASLGIKKVRITGGEPLVKRNIISICRKTARVEGIEDLSITTNGVLMPEMAKDLKAAGVRRVNFSIDTINPDKYAHITRIGKLDDALAGLEAALSTGFEKIKINAVLIGGFNDDEIVDLAGLTRRYPVDMRFIEMMPMYDGGDFDESSFSPASRVLDVLPEAVPVPHDGGVAKLYRLPGAQGNLGLIRPVSAHFCAECNRIRLTADGKIKTCLHSADEYDLKGMNLEEMRSQLRRAILEKPEWHGVLSHGHRSQAGRNMNQIGG